MVISGHSVSFADRLGFRVPTHAQQSTWRAAVTRVARAGRSAIDRTRALAESLHGAARVRRYQQILLSNDQLDRSATWDWNQGWPFSWLPIPNTILACLDTDPDDLARRLAISFDQRVDLADGLGDRPTAILELQSGLRFRFALYPDRGWLPHWRNVNVEVDPTTVNRPFIDDGAPWRIVECYRDELIDEIMGALRLPGSMLVWRAPPQHTPSLSTPEGMDQLTEASRTQPPPKFERWDIVRVYPEAETLKHLTGEGVVVARFVNRRAVRVGQEWREVGPQWRYLVGFPELARVWRFWESELEATGRTSPELPIKIAW